LKFFLGLPIKKKEEKIKKDQVILNYLLLEIAGFVVLAHGSGLMRLRIGEEPLIRLLTSIGIERV
jgi:hypothetical protein